MKTVLNVKTDKEVKEKAQALAKHLGIPLSIVVNSYLKDFIETGTFSVSREPQLRPEVYRRIAKRIEAREKGDKTGFSPTFDNAEDAIKWLNS